MDDKTKFYKIKKQRREEKKKKRRNITGEEVIYIFELFLQGWKPIKIFNTIIQSNPNSNITKKITEQVVTGNCKVFESELSKERYEYYCNLREQVYE
jgi:hypothetical protein